MTVQGGPAQPVHVVEDSDLRENGGAFRLMGGAALPVYGFTEDELDTTGRGVGGGKAIPVYIVSQDDIDTGRFKRKGGEARPTTSIVTERGTIGGAAIPVYLVDGTLT